MARLTFLKIVLASALGLLPVTACGLRETQTTSSNPPAGQAADPLLDSAEQTLQQLEDELSQTDTLEDAEDVLK